MLPAFCKLSNYFLASSGGMNQALQGFIVARSRLISVNTQLPLKLINPIKGACDRHDRVHIARKV